MKGVIEYVILRRLTWVRLKINSAPLADRPRPRTLLLRRDVRVQLAAVLLQGRQAAAETDQGSADYNG